MLNIYLPCTRGGSNLQQLLERVIGHAAGFE